jgi:hypothetical protein
LHDGIRVQQRRPGVSGGPILDARHGDDLHRRSGRWHVVTQVKDRLNDRYVKTVWDPGRRRYTKYQKEPLSRHVPDSQKLPPGALRRTWNKLRLWIISQPRRWRGCGEFKGERCRARGGEASPQQRHAPNPYSLMKTEPGCSGTDSSLLLCGVPRPLHRNL